MVNNIKTLNLEHKHKFQMFPFQYEIFLKRMIQYSSKARPSLKDCTTFFKEIIQNKHMFEDYLDPYNVDIKSKTKINLNVGRGLANSLIRNSIKTDRSTQSLEP
eukprot:CAMPEP_0116896258 /NCGR_PEP_ID=MMETSP0467-20121206/5549_1 /TAXON_ID=283647 /ORGANISM="Mesodinium pulex, Strain SPMC105" /LENGTH=103 /DNA_ID=CAMNT_0004567343 /DNA_START=127 /DNA_END=438 /DNA_ORIENTATION=-